MKLHKSARAGLLGLAALIWGTAFVAQSMGMDHLGPCAFNGARSFVGAMALLPVIAVGDRLRRHAAPEEAVAASWKNPALLLGGLLCGLFLGAASLLQQVGLQSTTAGKAGFLTSLYIVFVPVLGLFLGRRGGKKLWLAVALALGGAYLLSVAGGLEDGGGIGRGDGLVLASAALFSFHILVIDRFSPRVYGHPVQRSGLYLADCGTERAGPCGCLSDSQLGVRIRGSVRLVGVGPASEPPGDGWLRFGVCRGSAGPAAGAQDAKGMSGSRSVRIRNDRKYRL